MKFKQQFGMVCRRRRKATRLSQVRFGVNCNMDFGYYSRIERGQANWTIDIVERIANNFGVPVFQLFKEANDFKLTKKRKHK